MKSPVRIGPDVWLGTKVTVLRGVSVGQGCVVAANAVVNKDLPAYSVAVGVPARVVRDRLADHEAAARELATKQEMPLAECARLFALLNMGLANA